MFPAMKNFRSSACCAVLMAFVSPLVAGGEGWSSDFAAAKKQAADSKKDLLLDFTGSDWCGWCIKLHNEVFKEEAFKTGVKDAFVLVEIDFPRDKSKLPDDTLKQNKELGEKYAIEGYPTILLCDAEGRPYAATGYEKGGAANYVQHLNGLRAKKVKRDELFATAAKEKGVPKAKALVEALELMALEPALVTTFYGDIAGQIKSADPKDETGFSKKLELRKRLADFHDNFQQLMAKGDFDAALKSADGVIREGVFAKEDTLQIMMYKAVAYGRQKKFDEAIKAVDAAKAFAPDAPEADQMDSFRKRLEEEKAKAAPAAEEKPAAKD